ncbi:DUF456 family protein [Methylobacterium currus]|uniref:DUF456 family protein n=1 Tax=Methylobacterium currus TaxID=2051553 RepID=UPI001E60D0EE|nr:DUF456 family protein [Methylobacterium currus]UHC19728.1 DUF456 family protein [Methylobacterium currus]
MTRFLPRLARLAVCLAALGAATVPGAPAAQAQSRTVVGAGAGAVAGALVAGPIGAVVGGVVGAAWGESGRRPRRAARRVRRHHAATPRPVTRVAQRGPAAAPARPRAWVDPR